jgi:very-short-patch-repair endonuclease
MSRQLDHDRRIAELAAARYGVVSRHGLLAAGVSAATIDLRVRQRRLVRLHRGVYAVGHAELRREGWWAAAVEAHGADAALSHLTAATHWGIHEGGVWPVHVSIARRGGRSPRRGIVLHRVDLPEDEVVVHEAIRTTTVARTLLDLAGAVRGRALEQAVRQAARLRRFDLREQRLVLDRHPRARGTDELRRLLQSLAGRGTDDVRSPLEVAFAQLCDDRGLPRPRINAIILGERVDFSWPGTTLVVETDGFAFHAMPTTFAADRRRDQKLTLAGYTVIRVTYHQVIEEPEATAATVSALLSRCQAT